MCHGVIGDDIHAKILKHARLSNGFNFSCNYLSHDHKIYCAVIYLQQQTLAFDSLNGDYGMRYADLGNNYVSFQCNTFGEGICPHILAENHVRFFKNSPRLILSHPIGVDILDIRVI